MCLRAIKASSRVEEDGWDAVAQAIRDHGGVIIVCWHQRLMMTPYMFRFGQARCRSLTSSARAGRVVGALYQRFGYETIPMPKGMLGTAEMRHVIKGLKSGISIAISPDGPTGPARIAKTTPIQWARVAQVPTFVFTFSCRRFWIWPSWDRLMFPKPFNEIILLWREWECPVPRKLNASQVEALALDLQGFMNDVSAEADRRMGHDQPQI
jgi:lysophospholipid acyltransferase (LPLAT)-like uncharacterized protein